MFGLGNELNALFETVSQWSIEQIDEKIEAAKRELASAKRQKQLVVKFLTFYKASQERQKKQQKAFTKKQKAAMRRMPKFPPGFYGGPIGVAVPSVPGKKG